MNDTFGAIVVLVLPFIATMLWISASNSRSWVDWVLMWIVFFGFEVIIARVGLAVYAALQKRQRKKKKNVDPDTARLVDDEFSDDEIDEPEQVHIKRK